MCVRPGYYYCVLFIFAALFSFARQEVYRVCERENVQKESQQSYKSAQMFFFRKSGNERVNANMDERGVVGLTNMATRENQSVGLQFYICVLAAIMSHLLEG